MALVINNTPATYSSVNGDLVFTAYDSVKAADPVTYVNFKYVCDVYVGGTMVSRLKAFPSPDNLRGIFNIGRIVRAYIATQFNPAASALVVQELGVGDWRLNVQCKFGEEYGGVLYTNITLGTADNYYNHYNGRLTSSETILTPFANKVASNRAPISYVSINGARSFIPYFAIDTFGISVNITALDETGTPLWSDGSGTSAAFTPSAAGNLILLDLSPDTLNTYMADWYSHVIDSSIFAYKVYIQSLQMGAPVSEIVFNVYCEPKFTPQTLHFMNKLGGFESFDFRKVSRDTIDFTSKTFQQQDYKIDSSGVSLLKTSGNVMNDNVTTYAVQYYDSKLMTSAWMSDAEYKWLDELIKSPIIYYDHGSYLEPVVISVDTTYEKKKNVNDKATVLVVNVQFPKQLTSQYR